DALPEWLDPGDVLVRNNTRVIPARLCGHREGTGGRWGALYLRTLPDGGWEGLATCRGQPIAGERVIVGQGFRPTPGAPRQDGRWVVRPEVSGQDGDWGANATTLLERHGQVPLPRYIRKGQEGPGDRLRYQTLYAQVPGAVAAPTAGLHFTHDLFQRLE